MNQTFSTPMKYAKKNGPPQVQREEESNGLAEWGVYSMRFQDGHIMTMVAVERDDFPSMSGLGIVSSTLPIESHKDTSAQGTAFLAILDDATSVASRQQVLAHLKELVLGDPLVSHGSPMVAAVHVPWRTSDSQNGVKWENNPGGKA
jgi:hypothetical protein